MVLEAEAISQKMGDEFVSIEPLLLALLRVSSTARMPEPPSRHCCRP